MYRFFKRPVPRKKVYFIRLPLLVPDAHHRHSKGFRMSHPCTHASPAAVHRSVCKFYQIKGILHKLLKFRLVHLYQLIGLVLACKPYVQYRQRLCPYQFTQKEIFIIAYPQRLIIMGILCMPAIFLICLMYCPAVEIAAPLFCRPDALLPAITVFQCISLDDTSSRKTQKSRMKPF